MGLNVVNRTFSDPACRQVYAFGRGRLSWRAAFLTTASLIALAAGGPAMATDIGTGSTVKSSTVGSGNIDFKGGTLQLDAAGTLTNDVALEAVGTTNTIDVDGHAVTMSGLFSGTGTLTIANSASGGVVTLSNSGNTYTGATTINTGATLALSGTGSIATSIGLADNGVFDISATTSGASIESLSGSGNVTLGSQTLAVTAGNGTISGVISGTGGFTLGGGEEILTGTNTYTGGTIVSSGELQLGNGGTTGSVLGNVRVDGGTLAFDRTDNVSFNGLITGGGGVTQGGTDVLTLTQAETYAGSTVINSGTLALSSTGSIANSSVAVGSIFDISATSGTAIRSLSGGGTVNLGGANLTVTAGNGTFTGTINGTGGLFIAGGTQTIGGTMAQTGGTTVSGTGILGLSGTTVANNITDNGSVSFVSTSTVNLSGVISGTGTVTQTSGVASISSAQTYSGSTNVSEGTLILTGAGSIMHSSTVRIDGTLDISAANGDETIASLSGGGTVNLGANSLIFSNASDTFDGVIDGSGGIQITGGKETLTNENTFTGPTVISGGTLIVANSAGLVNSAIEDDSILDLSQANAGSTGSTIAVSLGGSGSVLLGPTTLVLSAANDTYSGTIAGAGGLTIQAGTETLSGANTYSGVTTIQNGTLMLTGGGSLSANTVVADAGTFDIHGVTAGPTVTVASLTGPGTVVLGNENLELDQAAGVFAGAITGDGKLIVSGGTATLSGNNNSYTGGTTITGGTLQLGAGSASGSIVGNGNVTDNGTLAFDRSDSYTFTGAISGTGQVAQIGGGTTILTATNFYTGGTTISSGTLQIGSGGTAGSISGNVTDNGTLAFDRTDPIGFSGTISGTGGVTQMAGVLTLTQAESYSGTTQINNGAQLILTGSGSIANSSVVDNGTLDLTGTSAPPAIASLAGTGSVLMAGQTLTISNGAGNYSGVISGAGGVTLTGGTNEIFSGTETYTGPTTINGGRLTVNGSIAASSGETVNAGGTLAGSGTVGGVTLNATGAIAPGSGGTGTLTASSVSFTPTSNFIVDLTSAGAGKLVITGPGVASIAGTLSVVSVDGTYPFGQKLTVLTDANGITGTFVPQQITGTLAQYVTTVTTDAHDVFAEVSLAKLAPLLQAATGNTTNEINVVNGIDMALAGNPSAPAAFQNLGTLTPAALQSDAAQLASEVGADASRAGNSLFDPFLTAMDDHMADIQPNGGRRGGLPQGDSVWGKAIVGTQIISAQDGTLDSHRLNANITAFVVGGDWHLTPSTIIGVAGSTGSSDFHLADASMGQGKASGFQLGVYALTQFSRHFYGAFTGAVALDDIKTLRTIDVAGTDTLQGKYNAKMFGGRYETGVAMGWISPYVAVQDAIFDAPKYTEAHTVGTDNFALTYAGHTTNYGSAELGFRQRVDISMDEWMLKLTDRLAWKHDMSATPSTDAAFAMLPGSTFSSLGGRDGKNAALLSLGASLGAGGFAVDLHFDGDISDRAQSYTEAVGLKYTW
jgi:autotransporter-associated beta strand protein